MRRFATLSLFVLVAVCLASTTAFAQVRTAGQLVGVVEDPTGAVIPGAKVIILSDTGVQKEISSGADGKFVIPDLTFGRYRVTVSSEGFRTAVYPNIQIEVGQTANLTVKLEVGATAETITVESGTEVLQTTSPTIENVITGRTLRQVPLNNRDVLDFVLLMPGAQQAGSARQSTFNGLPKGAINITMDGLNVQDNLLKSSFGGGMFTLIRPKVDSVEEISVSTAVGGADSAGEGAVQIKFVTRRGTNDYNGGAFWYHRHESYNANTWINNANGLDRNKNRLQQYGFNIGGPIIRDKAFFFFSYEDFRLPEARQRNNRVLTTEAQAGLFRYTSTSAQAANPNAFTTCDASAAQQCVVDLFALAAANGLPSTIDPVTQSFFSVINPLVAGGRSPGSLFYDRFIYAPSAGQRRWFPTMRLDWNISDKLRWHGIANFNRFDSNPDTLNRMDAAFPGLGDLGGQFSNRMSLTTALNWEIAPTLTYELRVGRQSSVVQFFPETIPSATGSNIYPDGYRHLWPFGLNNPHTRPSASDGQGLASRSFPSSRTVPVLQWGNNVGWLKGKHSINFGTSLTVVTHWDGSYGTAGVPAASFGLVSPDPALSVIASGAATIPGLSTGTDQTNARNLYAMLVGSLSSVSGSTNVDEISKTYTPFLPLTQRNRQNEYGFYVTDQWRAFQTLTITGGIRWEFQPPGINRNDLATSPSFEDTWGQSGVGNLFQPGASSGLANGNQGQLQQRSKGFHDTYMKGFAPSLGLAWQPKFEGTLARWLLGGPSKSVFRAGYSIAYTREGFNHFTSFGSAGNIGATQSNSASRTAGTIPDTTNPGNLIRNGIPTLASAPASFSFPIPFCAATGSGACMTFVNSLQTYDNKLRPSYVQSWSLGWQREINQSTVVEARYVANHGTRLWRSYNLNETNIFESNFLPEFIAAKANLDANRTGGCGTTFAPVAPCSSNALPIMTAAFSATPGTAAGTFASNLPGSSGFTSSAFITHLDQGQAGAMANSLAGSSSYMCRLAGNQFQACQNLNGLANPLGLGLFPSNLFRVNPYVVSAFVLTNNANSTYNAMQVELRRRLSKGLMVNFNYSFSKSLTDRYDDSAVSFLNFTTFRNHKFDKGLSPSDIAHTMRMFWIYEFPFGAGKRWSSGNAIVNRVIGGWEFLGVIALQSGRPFLLTSNRATLNQNGAFVVPNVSRKQLQKMVKINKVSGRRFAYFVDPGLVAGGAYPTGTSSSASANFSLVDVPTTPGELGQKVFLHGPSFFKPDLTIVKKTSITERITTEFRAEFFNAINRTNWLVGSPSGIADTANIEGTTFGQTTNFMNDLGNQDQGPRMIQFVLRINF